ncbi:MAG: transglycosylase SLT domain-containing protein [Prevotella sp.]|nr:transglycosylase SLT domain-containing protein [Prevotella sp.]
MDKFIKVLCLSLTVLMFVPSAADAGNRGKKKSSEVNWEPVINAIIQVESNGKCTAKNGNQCGAMQITPILVRECNDILKKKGCKKRYKLSDRFNLEKSKEMFLLIQSFHNPKNSIEHAIRSWNGGQQYTIKSTQRYFEKVMSYL